MRWFELVFGVLATRLGKLSLASSLNGDLLESNNLFAFELLETLYDEKEGKENLWISSFSVESCLSVAYEGAMDKTRRQMAETLHYPLEDDDNNDSTPSVLDRFMNYSNSLTQRYDGAIMVTDQGGEEKKPLVRIGNRIWLDSDYEQVVQAEYRSEVGDEYFHILDLQAADTVDVINQWISNKTDGMISDALDKVNDNDLMLITNTLYVDALWNRQFLESMTSESTFYTDVSRQTSKSTIHLMHQVERFDYYEDDQFQYVRLDSAHSEGQLFVMLALPKDTSQALVEMDDIEKALNNMESTRVALAVPKFSIQEGYALKRALQTLGMTDAFKPYAANFSKMASDLVYISSVQHNAALEVTEKGFTASALTIVTISFTSVQTNEPVLFKADHPFYFLIIDTGMDEKNTPVVLFNGWIKDITIPEDSYAPYNESSNSIWTPAPYTTEGENSDHRQHPHWLAIFWAFCILWLGAW